MNLLDVIEQTVTSVQVDEEPEPADDFGALEPRELDAVLAQLAIYSSAIRLLQHQARARFADYLGTRGFARFGDRVYRAAPRTTERVKDDRRNELYHFIIDRGQVHQILPLYAARKGALRKLAENWADAETGELGWRAFRDYFYDIEEGEVDVSEMPVDKAPQFIQKLDDGTVESRG